MLRVNVNVKGTGTRFRGLLKSPLTIFKFTKILDNLLFISKISLQDSCLVKGVAFKKTFSYAGFEMQPKSYKNPLIALLNIELELKAEKDNAEIRIDSVTDYQQASLVYRLV